MEEILKIAKEFGITIDEAIVEIEATQRLLDIEELMQVSC